MSERIARSVLLLCGSLKPAPGVARPSAARQLLGLVGSGIAGRGVPTESLDLRELPPLPHFDGRDVSEYHNDGLDRLHKAVTTHDITVLSVPAYWGMPSGPLVNALHLLGGANYDGESKVHPLSGRTVFPLVVGADDFSAHQATALLRAGLIEYGCRVGPAGLTVGNIQRQDSRAALAGALSRLIDAVAASALGDVDDERRPAT